MCKTRSKRYVERHLSSAIVSAAEIFLIAPISTSTLERDFSTMNRILTKLRNRLTTEYVEQLMRISIEGTNILNEETKNEIINCWKLKKPRR